MYVYILFQVTASGPGLEKTGVTVNKWAEFTVDARQTGKAPLHIAAMDSDYNPVEVCDAWFSWYEAKSNFKIYVPPLPTSIQSSFFSWLPIPALMSTRSLFLSLSIYLSFI